MLNIDRRVKLKHPIDELLEAGGDELRAFDEDDGAEGGAEVDEDGDPDGGEAVGHGDVD